MQAGDDPAPSPSRHQGIALGLQHQLGQLEAQLLALQASPRRRPSAEERMVRGFLEYDIGSHVQWAQPWWWLGDNYRHVQLVGLLHLLATGLSEPQCWLHPNAG